ncbi:Retrovirus-related Pol polyprotein from transposon opus [Araneus ventricosus]|uniref:RNA-directed DNA polymerase n=1 Tax=Araneus ventricosus TaxID=182803 RepID=A0A4Y2C0N4_ARAVE|nr:Retrovirus-related Pol polyprotein from transposon opus [Araneus ventricosus]
MFCFGGSDVGIYLISESDKLSSSNDEFSESNKFRKLQREFLTLKNSFKDASLKKNFFLQNELLFHKDKICGDMVYQLVLPKSYRDKVHQLAHNEKTHLGKRKTRERIKLSFYWPNVSKDVENYCRTYQKCQLKSPEQQSDKIPITPVIRVPYPFHTVNVDLIGEIVPPLGRRHKYCLCLIDQNSRWPEVMPLKNLSAKTTCDALLEILMRIGIPEIICSDQGNNFTSQLTKEFEDRLGSHTQNFHTAHSFCLRFRKSGKPCFRGNVSCLHARWTGPGEIIDTVNPHSYKVKLPDGNVRHIHANKIQFHTKAQTVGVIFEDDVEFGEIHPTPIKTSISNYNIEVDVSHLEEHKQVELLELLHNHAPLFSGKLQVANVGEHKIRLIPGTERKKPYIYKIPESLKLEVNNQIAELESLGLIEPSEAEIAYPIVCVAKKDSSMRLCIDFRLLNAVTKPFDYPMENITDLINQIGHAHIITCLDALKGYWEIPLEEESHYFISFKMLRAQYRWKIMPFGLCNAAASFQKVMNSALSEYPEFCKAFDDIAIFSCEWDMHLKHLDVVLPKLTELKFTVNVMKCVFAKTQLKYLGHIIGAGRHEPDPEKLRAIEIIERPTTKSALKSALGLFNYYRNYIKNYAEIAKPLTDLTKRMFQNLSLGLTLKNCHFRN